jgi:hypothetical protein
LLKGAKAALVETPAGWQLIQFEAAGLLDVDKCRPSRLLRGRQGGEPALAAGAPTGARIVFLKRRGTAAGCRGPRIWLRTGLAGVERNAR